MKAYTISLFHNGDVPERKWVVIADTPQRAENLLRSDLGEWPWKRFEIAEGGNADAPEGVIGIDDED
jgi:hypothetical protein